MSSIVCMSWNLLLPLIKPRDHTWLIDAGQDNVCHKDPGYNLSLCKESSLFLSCPHCGVSFMSCSQNICIIFIQRRLNVFDVGPTLYKCYTNILCLLGCRAHVLLTQAGKVQTKAQVTVSTGMLNDPDRAHGTGESVTETGTYPDKHKTLTQCCF